MKQVASFTTWLIYLQVETPWYLLKRLGGPQSWSWCFRDEKTILSLLGTEPWIVQTKAYSQNRLCYPGFWGATGILNHNFFFTSVKVPLWVILLLQLACCDTDSDHIPDKHYDSRQLDPMYTKLMRKLFLLSTHLKLLPTSSIVKFTNSTDTSNCQCSKNSSNNLKNNVVYWLSKIHNCNVCMYGYMLYRPMVRVTRRHRCNNDVTVQ